MFKRGIGYYVVLAMCVLGLVLQPVSVFASDFLFSNYDELYSALNSGTDFNFLNPTRIAATQGIRIAAELAFSELSEMLDESFNYWSAVDSPIYIFDGLEDIYPIISVVSITHYYIIYVYLYDTPIDTINSYIPNDSFLISCGATYDLNTSSASLRDGGASFDAPSLQLLSNSQSTYYIPYGAIGFDGFFYAIEGYTNQFVTPSIPVPDLPNYPGGTGNTYNPDANSGQVNWPNFVYMIASWFFYNGVMNTNLPGQSQTVNYPGTVGIGAALTYDWLCKVNLGNSTVSYLGNDYPNYLFQLSELMYMIDESIGHFADNIEDLDIGSIGSDISSIKSDIEAAFPAEEAEVNAAIADAIMDPESDNHISAAGIVQSKSYLDEGLSAFDVDTSGSVYSSPFAAISNPDNWIFFSQDTAANLQVQPIDASLQGVDNLSDLPYYNSVNQQVNNMMGWGD